MFLPVPLYMTTLVKAYSQGLFPKAGGFLAPNFGLNGNGMPTIAVRLGRRSYVMPIGSGAQSATPTAGGSGYAVNDTITLVAQNGGVSAVLKVTNAPGGVVSAVSVVNPGAGYNYSSGIQPSIAQQSTSGSGSGATFRLTLQGSAYPIP